MQYVRTFWRWWHFFVFLPVAGVFAALLLSLLMMPIFAASTTLLINPVPGAKPMLDINTLQTSEGLARTYVTLVHTRPILDQVIGNLGLTMSADQLDQEVSLTLPRDTQLIVLTVEDVNGQRAADIANEIVRVFGRENRILQPSGYELIVAEPAQASSSPVRPRPVFYSLLGAVLGGMLAVGWIFYKAQSDRSVKSIDDVRALVDIPMLCAVPWVKVHDGVLDGNPDHSPAIEAYRRLRTQIDFQTAGSPIRTILVTSGAPQEGKSFSAANLAVAVANSGRQVVLVDADLRRPRLHKIFRQGNARGLITMLTEPLNGNLSDHIVPTGTQNLFLMPSWPVTNPAELLASQRMTGLIEALKALADIVIIDSPPVLAVADATLIAPRCDATLLVARAESTQAEELQSATEELAMSGARVMGVVLNALPENSRGYYYRGYYS